MALLQDLRIGGRSLSRRPGFTLGVALTLGVGVGATTAVYSVVDGVLLRPLPYTEPSSLVTVGAVASTREWVEEVGGLQALTPMSTPTFVDLRARARSFQGLAAIERSGYPLADAGDGPEMVVSARVTAELFPLLGASPALGRTFTAEDVRVRTGSVVMLSYGAWQRRYGGDPNVLGQQLDRSRAPVTIVGVLPPEFEPPAAFFREDEQPELWFPLSTDAASGARRDRGNLLVLGRLAPGIDIETARSELDAIASALAVEFPGESVRPDGSTLGIGANALHAQTVGATGTVLRIFLAAAALLLALATMNSAMLFFARTMDRRKELGIRAALGAGRARVMALLAAEALLLAAAGGAIGVAIAQAGVQAFVHFAPDSIPRIASVAVDGRVLGLAVAISLGAGIVAGLLPATRLTARSDWERMQRTNQGKPEAKSILPALLVGGQTAAAVVLLSCAALLFSSFVRIRSVDPGFDPDGLISMRVDIEGFARSAPDEFTSVWAAWDTALEEIASVPGVESVAAASDPPFRSPSWSPRLLLPGDPPETWREGIAGYALTPGYLETMRTRLLRGRDFSPLDGPDAERVALVNESFVRLHLAGADPLGLVIQSLDGPRATPIRIVGVVEDVVQARVEEGPRPAIYVPYTQTSRMPYAVVRSSLPFEVIGPDLRRAVGRFNPIVPLQDLETMGERIATTRATPRFQAMLIGGFALVALLLAVAGLYGSLAHAIGRRRRELGVRMALGADRVGVLWMVVRQGMLIAATGLAVGMIASFQFTRLLEDMLYQVQPNDPATLIAVATAFLVISAFASLAPARRATGVDPISVLKEEP